MMSQLTALWNRFRNEESGATMVEYGLIVALVAVAAITAVSTLGTDVLGEFTNISTELQK
jgi:pilus assembly protein Flp/PilA